MANLPASAYGAYPTATVLPGLMSAADHLTTNYGVVPTPTLIASHKTQRTDRLEVCREFQRGNCKRPESECRFAHPPDHLQVDASDGVVTVCMDFVKGRCSRDQCRYLHPPPHLQAQLKLAHNRPNSAALVGLLGHYMPANCANTTLFMHLLQLLRLYFSKMYFFCHHFLIIGISIVLQANLIPCPSVYVLIILYDCN
ncbi:unnamed protein product [Medioppia subpectinata]|uniref:C3H1-type domain-containing protein n=1 Tax=Medioppia subpectinata TaxID=1979941 RepID=A0A7R9KUJ9_9ACAR|nr:unnamed protein product [Medioppia subpectinata]CAG2110153.1 unnamed protein product [Medioppia subpectinata]